MNRPKGGNGKKAPYESTHVRIPAPIKDRVEEIKDLFFSGTLEYHDECIARDAKLAREYENLLTGKTKDKVWQVNDKCNVAMPSGTVITGCVIASIQSDWKTCKLYVSETDSHFLADLKDLISTDSTNSLTSLDNAKEEAKKIIRQKKSAKESIARLLTILYGVEVTKDDLNS